MQTFYERRSAGEWQNLDCAQLWQLIQRMRAVSIGDLKMARAIDDLSQDQLPDTACMARFYADSLSYLIQSKTTQARLSRETFTKGVTPAMTPQMVLAERKAILNAALSLLGRTAHPITRRQLAREAGVTVEKLLKQFRSLADLRAELGGNHMAQTGTGRQVNRPIP